MHASMPHVVYIIRKYEDLQLSNMFPELSEDCLETRHISLSLLHDMCNVLHLVAGFKVSETGR